MSFRTTVQDGDLPWRAGPARAAALLWPVSLMILGLFWAQQCCAQTWSNYGGDPGGSRYSASTQIKPGNVAQLSVAWTFHTRELGAGLARRDKLTFEATPILVGRTLYFTTATALVFAVDAVSGQERWHSDPRVDRGARYSEMSSRGVSYWADPVRSQGICSRRLFVGTIDARLIALDAQTGSPCNDFGAAGAVDLSRGVRLQSKHDYQITSPAAIIGDNVIVGSSIGDNRATNVELGVVRAYDARSGALRWRWDPLPRDTKIPNDASNPDFTEVAEQSASWTGAANAWSIMSSAPQQHLVFVPTGSASPDFFGGERPGDNRWADSVVALDSDTGKLRWGQQLVHHDLWDYDVASQPVIADLHRSGAALPVVIQATKTGQVFVFERDTGRAVYRVSEQRVPQDAVAGELASSTQPLSSLPALVPRMAVTAKDAWGLTFWDRNQCAKKIAALRSDGIFTPPSLRGSLLRPGYVGGANWGGLAFDAQRQLAVVTVVDLPMVVTLLPRAGYEAMRDSDAYPGSEFAAMRGTPYGMRRELLKSPWGVPCTAPPWGLLVAVDLTSGKIAWRVPLGTTRDLAPWPFWYIHGVPSLGGPIVTRSGLVFVGAAADNYLRAFDAEKGTELWKGRLPGGGQATPMTYELDGRQFVVIAAGGYAGLGTTMNDTLVAFALPPR